MQRRKVGRTRTPVTLLNISGDDGPQLLSQKRKGGAKEKKRKGASGHDNDGSTTDDTCHVCHALDPQFLSTADVSAVAPPVPVCGISCESAYLASKNCFRASGGGVGERGCGSGRGQGGRGGHGRGSAGAPSRARSQSAQIAMLAASAQEDGLKARGGGTAGGGQPRRAAASAAAAKATAVKQEDKRGGGASSSRSYPRPASTLPAATASRGRKRGSSAGADEAGEEGTAGGGAHGDEDDAESSDDPTTHVEAQDSSLRRKRSRRAPIRAAVKKTTAKAKPKPAAAAADTQMYRVREIKDHRLIRKNRHYLVSWEGWPDSASTWEPEQNIPEWLVSSYLARVAAATKGEEGGSAAAAGPGRTATAKGAKKTMGGEAALSPTYCLNGTPEGILNNQLAQTLLGDIKKQESAAPFLHPVDAEGLGLLDYYEVVQQPMDLGTLTTRLAQGSYENVPQLVADLRLVWKNARAYSTNDVVSEMAEKLATFCESKLKRVQFASDPNALAEEVVGFASEDFNFVTSELSLHKGGLSVDSKRGGGFSPQASPASASKTHMQVRLRELLLSKRMRCLHALPAMGHGQLTTDLAFSCAWWPFCASQQVYALETLWPQHHKTRNNRTDVVYDTSSCPLAKNRHNTKILRKVLSNVLKQPHAWLFEKPVDPVELGVPDYFNVIKHPMDLGSALRKLDDGVYEEVSLLLQDIDLVWSNALLYNTDDSEVATMARAMRDHFDGAFEKVEHQLEGSTIVSPKQPESVPTIAVKDSGSAAGSPRRKSKKSKAEQKQQLLQQQQQQQQQIKQAQQQAQQVQQQQFPQQQFPQQAHGLQHQAVQMAHAQQQQQQMADDQRQLQRKYEEHRSKQEGLMAQHKQQLEMLEQQQLKLQLELQLKQQQDGLPTQQHQQERAEQQQRQQMQQEQLLVRQLEELQQHQNMQPPDNRLQLEQLEQEQQLNQVRLMVCLGIASSRVLTPCP
jgi:hypothetical protein